MYQEIMRREEISVEDRLRLTTVERTEIIGHKIIITITMLYRMKEKQEFSMSNKRNQNQ